MRFGFTVETNICRFAGFGHCMERVRQVVMVLRQDVQLDWSDLKKESYLCQFAAHSGHVSFAMFWYRGDVSP
jgi:hypothetical protein